MPMPPQKPGKSKQDYGTPPEFVTAVRHLLRDAPTDPPITWACDLAASAANTVCPTFYDEAYNSLQRPDDWRFNGWCWLNPPFANLRPWVEKARREAVLGARLAMLVPASVGANWWHDAVHHHCHVLCLRPRLQFVGTPAPYPKDLALLLYNVQWASPYKYWTWNWKTYGQLA
jgi:phage N-6-adenine-methyltransferase